MIKNIQYILLSIVILASAREAQCRLKTPLPVNYPEDTVGVRFPYIIWQDIYLERDRGNVNYRITLKKGDNALEPVLCYPDIYYKNFCLFQYPKKLKQGDYTYRIERLVNGQPIELQHFHYHKYPINGEFTVDTDETNDIDSLPPEYLVKYLFFERQNRYLNKYNSLFFGAGGLTTLGIGILFMKFLDFGIVSTVVSAVCFTASGTGFIASGIYGYRYFSRKSEMTEIVELGRNVSMKGGVTKKSINADAELSF